MDTVEHLRWMASTFRKRAAYYRAQNPLDPKIAEMEAHAKRIEAMAEEIDNDR
jgi:hypothetical protein